jgi:hypothetical protein
MLLPGQWLLCDDGVLRPVFRGRIATADGSTIPAEFLVDTGADRTVLCAAILRNLGLPTIAAQEQLGGVGGSAVTAMVDTAIHLSRDDGGIAVFRGQFAAFMANSQLSWPLRLSTWACSVGISPTSLG